MDRAFTGSDYVSSSSVFSTIDYFDITTTGNASDFGDITNGARLAAAVSDGSRAVIGGGLLASKLLGGDGYDGTTCGTDRCVNTSDSTSVTTTLNNNDTIDGGI